MMACSHTMAGEDTEGASLTHENDSSNGKGDARSENPAEIVQDLPPKQQPDLG